MIWAARTVIPSLGNTPFPVGRTFEFEADSFLAAVEGAEDIREDNERLISITMVTRMSEPICSPLPPLDNMTIAGWQRNHDLALSA